MALLLSACSTIASSPPSTDFKAEHLYSFAIYDSQLQQLISVEQLAKQQAQTEVLLFGEYHTHPAVHLAQLQVFAALYQQQPSLALSMEQFTRDQQALLDSYLNEEIGEAWLRKQTKAWDNYPSDYRPLVEFARQHQLSVTAANAPRDIVRCVGQHGLNYLDSLPTEQRSLVAERFFTDDSDYQQRLFGNAHHGEQGADNKHFQAMITWDETMAEAILATLDKNEVQLVMHTVGNFHIAERQGIYSRLLWRQPSLKVSSVAVMSPEEFGDTDKQSKASYADYILLVAALPPRYRQDEHRQGEFAQIHQHKKQCSLEDHSAATKP